MATLSGTMVCAWEIDRADVMIRLLVCDDRDSTRMRALTTAATATTMSTEPVTRLQGSVFKGKGMPRSWASLPGELVR